MYYRIPHGVLERSVLAFDGVVTFVRSERV